MGWRVTVPAGSLKLAEVDHLIFAVDDAFPNSQPRVFAPAAGSDHRWPHVEHMGLLCLRPTRGTASVSERIAFHLNDAEALLNFTEAKRRDEFEREFAAYWAQRATNSSRRVRVCSLVAPGGITREVFFYFDSKRNRYIIADDKVALRAWLRNSGANPGDKDIFSTWLFQLSRPWIPKEFPVHGRDVTRLLPDDMVARCLNPGMRSPFLFEATTPTGVAFAAVILQSAGRQDVLRGFRHISRVPKDRIVNAFANRPVERCTVSRIDGGWIHGRDHPSSYWSVKQRKVAIIGCGAIGGAVAQLLAQAGVGELILVDGDNLSTANVSRHLLGIGDIGLNKARSLQRSLRTDLPHLRFEHAFPKRFDQLTADELNVVAGVDLIVAAGIDHDGEAALDTWRRSLPQPPAYVSTWVEAYAVAGHAVLLYGHRSILESFDDEERPSFRLTDWPDDAGALIVEAGCGNSFQPHGVVELHPTVGLAAELALDTLLDKVPASCRRVWMGDPSDVSRNGGTLRSAFTDTRMFREYAWP